MLLEKILDRYENEDDEEMVRRRKPGQGNPTGSSFGKCAAQLVLHRYPDVGKPEPYRTRTVLTFEEGDRIEEWFKSQVKAVMPGLVGSAQGLTYLDVDLTDEEIHVFRTMIRAGWNERDRLWGKVIENFSGGRPRIREDGTLVAKSLDKKWGFVLDPIQKKLWAPIFIDFAVKFDDIGHAVVEIKSVADGTFRRAMLGELDASKKAQAAGIVEATGLPFIMLVYRKMTSHLLEIRYLPTPGGDVQVRIMKTSRVVEEFRVKPGTDLVFTPAGEKTALPNDLDWEIGEVWTPHDPALLAEIRARIKVVLLWRPGAALPREAGPSFRCDKCYGAGSRPCGTCDGVGTRTCGHCKGTGQSSAKIPRPCSYCLGDGGKATGKAGVVKCGGCNGGVEAFEMSRPGRLRCEKCESTGTLKEAPLPPMPCSYAVPADMPVLMADYSWKAAGKVEAGDAIIAVDEDPPGETRARKIRAAVVEAAAPRRKETVVIETERGTITSSPEHPWLVGWPKGSGFRWVEAGRIKPGQRVCWIGEPSATDTEGEDYMGGYIRGLVEGDGTVQRRLTEAPCVRVAMADVEALERLVWCLQYFGLRANLAPFASYSRRPMFQVVFGGGIKDRLGVVKRLLAWPLDTREAACGYLGGLYDAEGSLGKWSLRISQISSSPVVGRALAAAEIVGADLMLERYGTKGRKGSLRFVSKRQTADLVRFFSRIRPAIVRKAALDGWSVRRCWVRVLSVAPGPEADLVDLQTSSKTFIAGGFVSHNCAVKEACYGDPLRATGIEEAFRLEVAEGKAPKWMVNKAAWDKAGLSFVTPPSHRKPDLGPALNPVPPAPEPPEPAEVPA